MKKSRYENITETGVTYDKEQHSTPRARGGDPGPDGVSRSVDGVRHHLTKTNLLAILVIVSVGLSAYSAIRVDAIFRQSFPGNGQLFSVSPAYSFASPTSNGVLVAGSYVNVTLTVQSIAAGPTPLTLSFNTTNPTEWGIVASDGCHTPLNFQMSISGSYFVPVNQNPGYAGACGAPVPQGVTVTVNPGVNTYTGRLQASLTVSPESMNLFWFASQ